MREIGTSHAVSHIAPAKFLCGMWRQDSATALASLDEPQVLRLVRPNFKATALDHGRCDRIIPLPRWLPGWSQTSTIPATTDTPTY